MIKKIQRFNLKTIFHSRVIITLHVFGSHHEGLPFWLSISRVKKIYYVFYLRFAL